MNGRAEKITKRNRAFWDLEPVSRPLINFRVSEEFPLQIYEGAKQLVNKKVVRPEDVSPASFLDDYERILETNSQLDEDTFCGFEAFWGIPWMEAILGCSISASDNSMWSHPLEGPLSEWLAKPIDLKSNPWFQKLIEFTQALVDLADGRCPVGQTLLRGPSDLLGAVSGREEAIIGLMTGPAVGTEILHKCCDVLLEVQAELNTIFPCFQEGYHIGMYNVWTPGPCCWFQEDATALYSPNMYRQHILPLDTRISEAWPYNLIHLHPASFYILDDLLTIPSLKCVQANVDTGSDVSELIPHFQKIQAAGKCLLVEARVPWDDLETILRPLKRDGTLYHMKASTVKEAQEIISRFHEFFDG